MGDGGERTSGLSHLAPVVEGAVYAGGEVAGDVQLAHVGRPAGSSVLRPSVARWLPRGSYTKAVLLPEGCALSPPGVQSDSWNFCWLGKSCSPLWVRVHGPTGFRTNRKFKKGEKNDHKSSQLLGVVPDWNNCRQKKFCGKNNGWILKTPGKNSERSLKNGRILDKKKPREPTL